MISFASTKGSAAAAAWEPASDLWYEVAKWQSLAAKQVAAETGIASVWSWGWGRWSAVEQDPAKHERAPGSGRAQPSLCNAPKPLGPEFDPSRATASSAYCPRRAVPDRGARSRTPRSSSSSRTGERDTAYSALFERLVEIGPVGGVGEAALAAERAVIPQSSGKPRRVPRRTRVGRARTSRSRAACSATSYGAPSGGQARRGHPHGVPDPDVLRVVSRPVGAPRPVEAAAVLARLESQGPGPRRGRAGSHLRDAERPDDGVRRAKGRSGSRPSPTRCRSVRCRSARRGRRSRRRSARSTAARRSKVDGLPAAHRAEHGDLRAATIYRSRAQST